MPPISILQVKNLYPSMTDDEARDVAAIEDSQTRNAMIRHILAGSLHRSVLQSSGLADIAGIRSRVQSRVQKERPIEKSILAAAGGAIVHPSRIAQPGSRIGRYANPPDHQVTAYSSGSTNKNFNKILTFPSTPKHPPVFGKQMEELGTAHANQDARRDDTIKRQEVYANRP